MTKESENAESQARMTPEQVAELTNLYESGDMNVTTLADHFGKSRQTISRRVKELSLVPNSKPHLSKNYVPPKEPERPLRFADHRPTWIEETKMSSFNALRQVQMLARKTVADEMKAPGGRMGQIDEDLKAIQRYGKTLNDNIVATMKLLDADEFTDIEDLTELRIEDLTEEDILDFHKRTGAISEDATVEDLAADRKAIEDIF